MSSLPKYLDRKNSGVTQTASSQIPAAPTTPQTPRKNPSSAYSSPSTGIRSEEDLVVLEIGARHLSVGYAGESRPKCTLGFLDEDSRRVGDYRDWLPAHSNMRTSPSSISRWGCANELWNLDLKNTNLGLMEDKLERAIRRAYSEYLLQDSKAKRILLVLPSVFPLPLLSSVLSTLFRNFQIPGVVLFPSPVMALIAAGQRCGIVVDIGWHETVVTAIYELREIEHARTTRAMKQVTLQMAKALAQSWAEESLLNDDGSDKSPEEVYEFQVIEEITTRLAWCQPRKGSFSLDEQIPTIAARPQAAMIVEERISGNDDSNAHNYSMEKLRVTLPKALEQAHVTENLEILLWNFSKPVESVFFGNPGTNSTPDDEEHAIHFAVHELLTVLQPDVRAACMSNIVFTGGGSFLPGLKSRVMDELVDLVDQRGWSSISGKAVDKYRERLQKTDKVRQLGSDNMETYAKRVAEKAEQGDNDGTTPPAFTEPEEDLIYRKIREVTPKDPVEHASGSLRCVESLGAWEGASITASLRIKGVVEIEREAFLQHGLAGAQRENEANASRSRQSLGAALGRPGAGEATAWTLGTWAA